MGGPTVAGPSVVSHGQVGGQGGGPSVAGPSAVHHGQVGGPVGDPSVASLSVVRHLGGQSVVSHLAVPDPSVALPHEGPHPYAGPLSHVYVPPHTTLAPSSQVSQASTPSSYWSSTHHGSSSGTVYPGFGQ